MLSPQFGNLQTTLSEIAEKWKDPHWLWHAQQLSKPNGVPTSKEWLIHNKLLELFLRLLLWKWLGNNLLLLVFTVLPVTACTLHLLTTVATLCLGLTLSSSIGHGTGSVSACTTDFIVRTDKKLWIGSTRLIWNCISFFFGTKDTVWDRTLCFILAGKLQSGMSCTTCTAVGLESIFPVSSSLVANVF